MAIKINGNTVIDDSRKLTNIADGSGELSFTGSSLVLSIGGTEQDTQELDDTHTHNLHHEVILANSQKIKAAHGCLNMGNYGQVYTAPDGFTNANNGLTFINGNQVNSSGAWVEVQFSAFTTLHSVHASVVGGVNFTAFHAGVGWNADQGLYRLDIFIDSGTWWGGNIGACVSAFGA